MTVAKAKFLRLEEFLKLAETKPAGEYIDGEIIQKPMPKPRHSRLQGKLINAINEVTETEEIAYAFPELRCTFGGRSIIPDIAVLRWQKIQLDERGELSDNTLIIPDWSIEILSPDQKANRVIDNLLHCIKHGCQLGWMIDPDDYSILIFSPQQEPNVFRGSCQLQILKDINLELTAEQVFAWLKIGK
ncbi:Uma2 family endonuclease [Planktothrix agardhii]|uniref:Uma2 family endonuclease n=1 Tax=Planktothrix agardhii TaxID=1160 RepID=UPI0004185106|nr:Uma2 family endonuclease [Planktothrix agardhii]